jgi:membrane associated rhomboid family serine protease
VFGREVEQVIGSRGLLRLYIMGALIASLGHLGFNFLSHTDVAALGASGAVMAIAVQYGALFPKRVLMINFFIPIPAAIAVAGYVLLDVWGMFSGGDGIAHAAHLGGAAYGLWHHAKRVRPYLQRG